MSTSDDAIREEILAHTYTYKAGDVLEMIARIGAMEETIERLSGPSSPRVLLEYEEVKPGKPFRIVIPSDGKRPEQWMRFENVGAAAAMAQVWLWQEARYQGKV